MIRAEYSRAAPVFESMTRTPDARLRCASNWTLSTTASVTMVSRPVFCAAGSVELSELKYAPKLHPRAHWSRAWHALRPFSACVRLATRVSVMCRPGNARSMPRFITSSAQFICHAGCSSPSGRCGRPSRSPATPMNFSMCEYHGASSSYRIGQSTPWPSRRLASKSRSLHRQQARPQIRLRPPS